MATEQSYLVKSLEDLKQLAGILQGLWQSGVIMRLWGDLGVGKTTLVRLLVGDEVSSPTYAIHHHYDTSSGPVEHLDLYRLETQDEIESAGAWEILALDQSRIVVEWPERLAQSDWPRDKKYLDVYMAMARGSRRIRITLPA